MTYLIRTVIPKVFNIVQQVLPVREHTLEEGYGVRANVGAYCKEKGYHKVLIITDENLIKLGLLDAVTDSLEENDIDYCIYDKVLPNPTFAMVDEATVIGLRHEVQCIIAFGGGSVLDTAKVASGCMKAPFLSSKFMTCQYVLTALNPAVPMITIPTTAGTGAETTLGVVISDNLTHTKYGSITFYTRIKHIILDTELTVGCPPYVTATTGFDALVHGIEGHISAVHHRKGSHRGTYSMECIRLAWENLRKAYYDGSDLEARANMAKSAYLGGLTINYESLGYGHSFGHTIGAKYNIPHGASLSISMPPVMRYSKDKIKDAVADIAINLGMGDKNQSADELFDIFMDEFTALIRELGLPEYCTDIKKEDYPAMIANVMRDSCLWAIPDVYTYHDAEKIFDEMSGNTLNVSEGSKAVMPMSNMEKGLRLGILGGTGLLALVGLKKNKKLCVPFILALAFHALEYIADKIANDKR